MNMNLMSAAELMNKMGNALCVTLTFYKKDGSLRVMRCNRAFAFNEKNADFTGYVSPNGNGLRYDNNAYGLVTVYDLESEGFRQVRAGNVLSVLVG
jgi:hypothetical protein